MGYIHENVSVFVCEYGVIILDIQKKHVCSIMSISKMFNANVIENEWVQVAEWRKQEICTSFSMD